MTAAMLLLVLSVSGSAFAAAVFGATPGLRDLRRPRLPVDSGPHWWAAALLGVLFTFAAVGNLLIPSIARAVDPASQLIDGVVSAVLIAGVAVLATRPITGLGFPDRSIGSSVRSGVLCGLAVVAPTIVIQVVRTVFEGATEEHPLLTELRERPSPTMIGAVLLSAVVLAPIAEEIAFRGIIQNTLARRVRGDVAMLVTGALFLAIHPAGTMIALVPITFGLGFVYHRTQSLPTVIAMHAAFNAAMISMTIFGAE